MIEYDLTPPEDGEYDDGLVDFGVSVNRSHEPRTITPEILALRRMPYGEYLRSPHWRATRRRAVSRAGGMCQRCRCETDTLEVHHLSYARRGCEADFDLIALCDICHGREHGKLQ